MSPFAKCCLLSGGCFHGPSESWSCSAIHLLCAHTDWAALQLTKQSRRQGIAMYQCDLPDSDGFFNVTLSIICKSGFCPVLGLFLSFCRAQLRTVRSSCSSLLVSLFSWEPLEQGVSCMSSPDGGSSSIDAGAVGPCYAKSDQTL